MHCKTFLHQYQTHESGNPIPKDVCAYAYLSHTKHTDYAVVGFIMAENPLHEFGHKCSATLGDSLIGPLFS